MKNKYDCDAYDSGYCYIFARPLTDEEDDLCEDCCCYHLTKTLNKENNIKDMTKDIYYIVGLKDGYKNKLKLTTVNNEFCGKFNHQAHGVVWFELHGSGAWVAIPDEWIEWIAPSKALWNT